jgi:DNA-directed RNA polymerase specialized sigma24 family protein
LETPPEIDFRVLETRLAAYGLVLFAQQGLGGRHAPVSGTGLSVEDFVGEVLLQYLEGRIRYDADRGTLFSLLAKALQNDIQDASRKAAHRREEARSPLPRQEKTGGPPSLDELPASGATAEERLAAESYESWVLEIVGDEPELAETIREILDSDPTTPRETAAALGIPVTEYQNRKKRLRRRLIQHRQVEGRKL